METQINPEHLFQLKNDLELIKKDVVFFGEYFKKIDSTIEKIEHLTQEMATLIRLHEERIQNQAKEDSHLKAQFENLEKKIDIKIDGLKETFQKDMKNMDKQVLKLTVTRAVGLAIFSIFTFLVGIVLTGYFNNFYQVVKVDHLH